MGVFEKDVQLGSNHVLFHASLDYYELKCRVRGEVYSIPRVGVAAFKNGMRQCPICYERLPAENKDEA